MTNAFNEFDETNTPHDETPSAGPAMGPASGTLDRPFSLCAIFSLVLAVLFLCLGPLGIVPLILGIIALTATGERGSRRGQGLAIAGVAVSSVGILGTCLSIGILLPALGKARQEAMFIISKTQLQQLSIAVQDYAADHAGAAPDADNWGPQLAGYLSRSLDDITESPAGDPDGDGVVYVYVPVANPSRPGQILFYEDPDHWPAEKGVLVGFSDGHAESMPKDAFNAMLAEQLGEAP